EVERADALGGGADERDLGLRALLRARRKGRAGEREIADPQPVPEFRSALVSNITEFDHVSSACWSGETYQGIITGRGIIIAVGPLPAGGIKQSNHRVERRTEAVGDDLDRHPLPLLCAEPVEVRSQ